MPNNWIRPTTYVGIFVVCAEAAMDTAHHLHRVGQHAHFGDPAVSDDSPNNGAPLPDHAHASEGTVFYQLY